VNVNVEQSETRFINIMIITNLLFPLFTQTTNASLSELQKVSEFYKFVVTNMSYKFIDNKKLIVFHFTHSLQMKNPATQ
jgi:hypothetical protein